MNKKSEISFIIPFHFNLYNFFFVFLFFFGPEFKCKSSGSSGFIFSNFLGGFFANQT